jgi:hypothetical protein
MMRANSRGSCGRRSVTGFGVSFRIEARIETLLSPVNGRPPVAISYSMTPSENRSLRESTAPPDACSGDM